MLASGALETVADETPRRLDTEQREVAETLQRSLCLQELPTVAGLEVVARYEAGVAGTEVGGRTGSTSCHSARRLLFSVGAVSGRGIEAAATMALTALLDARICARGHRAGLTSSTSRPP